MIHNEWDLPWGRGVEEKNCWRLVVTKWEGMEGKGDTYHDFDWIESESLHDSCQSHPGNESRTWLVVQSPEQLHLHRTVLDRNLPWWEELRSKGEGGGSGRRGRRKKERKEGRKGEEEKGEGENFLAVILIPSPLGVRKKGRKNERKEARKRERKKGRKQKRNEQRRKFLLLWEADRIFQVERKIIKYLLCAFPWWLPLPLPPPFQLYPFLLDRPFRRILGLKDFQGFIPIQMI